MSCHDIGRGMASVGEKVLRLYDARKYDEETAKQLLLATIMGVNYCDGNSYEAAASLRCRCAQCLREVDDPERELVFGERVFQEYSGIYDADAPAGEDAEFVQSLYMKDKLLAPQLCHDCLRELKTDFS